MYEFVDLKSPFVVNYEVTKVCNLRCNFCFAHDCEQPRHPSFSTVNLILEAMCAAEVFEICLFGGEFFCYPDWRKVILRARELHFMLTFISNGTLINRESARFLKKNGVNVGTISIQGLEETHDIITTVPGSFYKSIQGLMACLAEGIDITVLTTLTRENICQIRDLLEYLGELELINPKRFSYGVNRLAPFGLAREDWEKRRLSLEEYKSILPVLSMIKEDFGINVSFADAFPLCLIDEKYHDLVQGCWQFTGFGHISAEGNVRGCAVAQGSLGNLLDNPLVDIWNCRVVKDFRKQDWLPDICKKCEFACGAGCTASCVCDNLYAPDEFLYEKGLIS
ncbi:MAG: radical SAM protein [bacterium]